MTFIIIIITVVEYSIYYLASVSVVRRLSEMTKHSSSSSGSGISGYGCVSGLLTPINAELQNTFATHRSTAFSSSEARHQYQSFNHHNISSTRNVSSTHDSNAPLPLLLVRFHNFCALCNI